MIGRRPGRPFPESRAAAAVPGAAAVTPGGGRAFLVAGLAVLLTAAALRFHDLGGESLWYDEAVSVVVSRGSFGDLVENIRRDSTMAILVPLALRAVQSVEFSNASLRLLSAAASVLTVAGFLFLLPAVGVGRRAALFAAAMAALSWPAIVEAREVREYSVDALFALLLIAGLLHYLRERRRSLLTAALLLGPLVQYGLAFFGASVLVTAAALSSRSAGESGDRPPRRRRAARLRAGLRRRFDLLPPAAAFAAGAGLTFFLTARDQIGRGGTVFRHLGSRYYAGDLLDPGAAWGFVRSQVRELVVWHLPATVAAAALAGLALLLVLSLRARFAAGRASPPRRPLPERAAALLCGLSVAVAAGAALLALYPLGGTRQLLHLGPILFLAAALVFSRVGERVSAAVRFRWTAPAVFAVVFGGVAAAGAAELVRTSPYGRRGNAEAVLATLAERARPGEFVYATGVATPPLRFYLGEEAERAFRFGAEGCYGPVRPCVLEMARMAAALPERGERMGDERTGGERMWFVHASGQGGRIREEWRRWDERVVVEAVVEGEGDTDLFLLRGVPEALAAREAERFERFREASARTRGEPTIRAAFDLRLEEGSLLYSRKPCARADLETRFFLDFLPAGPGETPAGPGHFPGDDDPGPETRVFHFSEYGALGGDECVAVVPLPDGEYAKVRTGQWAEGDDRSWRVTLRLDRDRFRGAYESLVSGEWGEPRAQSDFGLFHDGTTLAYLREPCLPAEVEPRFLLHRFPSRFGRSPPRALPAGFENRDFDFHEYGVVLDGKCLALVPVAGDEWGRVVTGQWRAGEEPYWQVSLDLDRDRFRRAFEALAAGESGPPAASARFDLHLEDTTLLYFRESCGEADAAARFFLHAYPADRADLPESGGAVAFENLDFDFAQFGRVFDGGCLAAAPLPGYRIERLRTGQRAAGAGVSWEAEIPVGGSRLEGRRD